MNTYLKDITTQPIKSLGSWNILLHELNYIEFSLDHAYNHDHDHDHDENNLSEKKSSIKQHNYSECIQNTNNVINKIPLLSHNFNCSN